MKIDFCCDDTENLFRFSVCYVIEEKFKDEISLKISIIQLKLRNLMLNFYLNVKIFYLK